MTSTEKLAITAGALALLFALRRAAIDPQLDVRFPQGMGLDPELPDALSEAEGLDVLGVGLPGVATATRDYWDGEFMGPSRQVAAFLYMIRRAEHTAADVASGADYRTFYGGSRFNNLSDHPAITGEKSGVRLPPDKCRAAGFTSGYCVSTAAGAYQFIKPTWSSVREGPPRIPSFEPVDQDLAAIRLLDRIGALERITAGDVLGAIALASRQWASLPGSLARQNPKPIDDVLAYFSEGGGVA